MNKFTILLLAVCLVALATADPIRKNVKKSKSAKIVRAPAKLVKPVRRSGKLHAIDILEPVLHHETHHLHHEGHHLQHEPHLHHEQHHHQHHIHEGEQVLHEEHHITAVPVEDEHHHVHLVPVEDEVVPIDDVVEISADEIPEEVEVIVKETPFAPAHGSFFNTHFGAANNGAIGVANSYSTGANGKSESHATAHGAPAAHHIH